MEEEKQTQQEQEHPQAVAQQQPAPQQEQPDIPMPIPMVAIPAGGRLVKIELEATVIRADGSREELGKVDAYYANPVKQLVFNLRKFLKRKKSQPKTK